MKVDSLKKMILANYPFQVEKYTKLGGNNYRLETNLGPKLLSSWTNQALVEWAFRWREHMAARGYRQIDRFIRTKSGSAYVQEEEMYLVMQDLFEGEVFTPSSTEHYKQFGQFVGTWYQACTVAAKELPLSVTEKQSGTLWPKAMLNTEGHDQLLRAYKQKIAALSDSMFTYLIRQHWPSITKRYRQAISLERVSQVNQREGIFPLVISVDQWLQMRGGYIVFQTMEQQACPDFRGIASFLQAMYTQKQIALSEIEAWYSGFSQAYQADVNTHYHLLAQLIYPRQYIDILSAFLHHEQEEEASIEAWLTACQEQAKLDELHLWLAQWIDQGKQEQGLG